MIDEHDLCARGEARARANIEDQHSHRLRHAALAAAMVLAGLGLAPSTALAQQAVAADVAAASCSACHGLDGKSTGAIPSLDKLDVATMTAKLRGFKNNEIESTIMNRIAKGFSDAEIDGLVKFIAAK